MATKNHPGAYDCYANAGPDEPLFVLLGRDKHAPILVLLWSMLREADNEKPEKVQESQVCVRSMLDELKARKRGPAAGVAQVTEALQELVSRWIASPAEFAWAVELFPTQTLKVPITSENSDEVSTPSRSPVPETPPGS